MHTSCSQPLTSGNQFGGVEVVGAAVIAVSTESEEETSTQVFARSEEFTIELSQAIPEGSKDEVCSIIAESIQAEAQHCSGAGLCVICTTASDTVMQLKVTGTPTKKIPQKGFLGTYFFIATDFASVDSEGLSALASEDLQRLKAQLENEIFLNQLSQHGLYYQKNSRSIFTGVLVGCVVVGTVVLVLASVWYRKRLMKAEQTPLIEN